MRKSLVILLITSALLILTMPAGCSPKDDNVPKQDDILVEVGDSALTMRAVLRQLPAGLTEEDSVEMFNSIVDRWVRTMMLVEIAAENIEDFDEINRLAEDYRNNLIIERYLRAKLEESPVVSDNSVKRYYEVHKDEMKLEGPIIKGIYLKVSDSEEKIDDIRRWMATATPSAIDNIEKYCLKQASQYEYFRDNWIDWSEISQLIPYRFYDGDAFLGSTKDFETSYGGSVYLLHVFEFKPSGSVMPYEYASPRIAEILNKDKKSDYRQKLLASLYSKGIETGKLKPGLYDPVKRSMSDIQEKSSKEKTLK